MNWYKYKLWFPGKKSLVYTILDCPFSACEHMQTCTNVINRKQHAKNNLPYDSFQKSSGRGSEKQKKKKTVTNVWHDREET